jgi:hypothetical protein
MLYITSVYEKLLYYIIYLSIYYDYLPKTLAKISL